MVIEPLDSHHDRSTFDCGEESLDRYIKQYASQDAKRDLGVTYVAVDDETDPDRVIGYYTLAATAVASEAFSEEKVPTGRPIPMVLLGRLAVDKEYQSKKIGKVLLLDALRRARDASRRIAAFGVVVDALHEKAEQFYLSRGFIKLTDRNLHLYISMKTIDKIPFPQETSES